MSLQRPTIVLFDMDGTTVRHVNPKLLGLLECLDDISFRLGRLISRGGARLSTDDMPRKSKSLIVHRALHKIRKKPVEQIVQPCPGIYTVLEVLRGLDIPTGVVSNGLGKGYGHDILTKFHLTDYFSATVFREDFSRSKPYPDPLLRALKGLKSPLTKRDVIWYIGDRHKDIIAALAAEKILPCPVIPFSYGLHASVAILEKGLPPEQIIMNYHDFALRIHEVFEKKSEGADELNLPAPFNDNDPLAAA